MRPAPTSAVTQRPRTDAPGPTTAAADTDVVRAAVARILNRHPMVGFALGVVTADGAAQLHVHGLADIATGRRVTADTGFRIASISKTFTAIAVMQLRERGLVDLDAPVHEHLRAYALQPTEPGWPPVTIRHLLTHTAGLGELAHASGAVTPDFGESVPVGRPLPSLATFYGGELRVHAEPGTRFVYNNHGPATLGQIVEDVSGAPLPRYVREHILEPLGMRDSDLVRSPSVAARLATGYELGRSGVRRVDERDLVTAGAAAVLSTPADMARYLAALLGGGSNAHGTILQPATLAEMYAPQYQPDPRLSGMGLGFFRGDLGGHLVVRHQGTHPGFHSEIAVVPDAGVAVMAFTNGADHPDLWLPAEVAGLLRELLGLPPDAVRTDVPHRPDGWDDLCGWYRLDARSLDVRLRGMIGAGAEVWVRDGLPALRFLTPVPELYRGLVLYPDDAGDPDVFRLDLTASGLGTMRVAFGRDPHGAADRLHLEIMPLVLRKQPATTHPRRRAGRALAGLGALGAVVGVARLGARARRDAR